MRRRLSERDKVLLVRLIRKYSRAIIAAAAEDLEIPGGDLRGYDIYIAEWVEAQRLKNIANGQSEHGALTSALWLAYDWDDDPDKPEPQKGFERLKKSYYRGQRYQAEDDAAES
jgi:hypothetical protein